MAAKPSLADQVACVEREIALRERVYPRWVQVKRLTQEAADRELDRMRAVLHTLRLAQLEAVDREILHKLQMTPETSRLIRELTAHAYDERQSLGWLLDALQTRVKHALETTLEAVDG